MLALNVKPTGGTEFTPWIEEAELHYGMYYSPADYGAPPATVTPEHLEMV